MTLRIEGKTIVVGCIYRLPNGPVINFLNYVEERLNDDINDQTVILRGDLNIAYQKKKKWQAFKQPKRIIQFAGFKQIINKETRITDRLATLIDHIITNRGEDKIIGVRMKLTNSQPAPRKVYIRDFARQNLTEALIGENWNYTSTDVDVIYTGFLSKINEIFDRFAPLKKNQIHKYPWITHQVRETQRIRDESYRRFYFIKAEEDWNDYKLKRNRVISVIKSEKTKYFNRNIDECKGNGKKMWKTLK